VNRTANLTTLCFGLLLPALACPAMAQGLTNFRPSASNPANFRETVTPECESAKAFLESRVAGMDIAGMSCDDAIDLAKELGWKAKGGGSSKLYKAASAAAQAGAGKTNNPLVKAHGGVDPLGVAVKNFGAINPRGITKAAQQYIAGIGATAVKLISGGGSGGRGSATSGSASSQPRRGGLFFAPTKPSKQAPKSASAPSSESATAPAASPAKPRATATPPARGSLYGRGRTTEAVEPAPSPVPVIVPPGAPTDFHPTFTRWTNQIAQSRAPIVLSTTEMAELLERLTALAMTGQIAEGDALVESLR
jgi:hypothetical protein